jgi:hypothetical protein
VQEVLKLVSHFGPDVASPGDRPEDWKITEEEVDNVINQRCATLQARACSLLLAV